MLAAAASRAAAQMAATPADRPSMLSRKLKALVIATIQRIVTMQLIAGPATVSTRTSSSSVAAAPAAACAASLIQGPRSRRSSMMPTTCSAKAHSEDADRLDRSCGGPGNVQLDRVRNPRRNRGRVVRPDRARWRSPAAWAAGWRRRPRTRPAAGWGARGPCACPARRSCRTGARCAWSPARPGPARAAATRPATSGDHGHRHDASLRGRAGGQPSRAAVRNASYRPER